MPRHDVVSPTDRNSCFQPLETLEPRLLFTAVPLITEFLASNDNVLDDEDGDSSDWLEIYNAGDSALDLDGWHLTDNANDLSMWAFPAVSVDPGEYLVVFASNKDRADADGTELHTNFRIGAGGEYLALVEADGTTVAFEYAPEFPPQSEDISYGLAMNESVTTLVAEGAMGRYIVPDGPIATWNTTGFNDSGWSQGPTAIGYENAPADYASLIETAVPIGTGSVYLRHTFNVADPEAFDTLSLGLRYDDGFVAYLNGVRVAEMFAPGSPEWDSFAVGSQNHSDAQASEFEPFDLTPFLDELVAGNNVLAIQVMNDDGQSSDLLLEPVLTGSLTTVDVGTQAYMVVPTPGATNFLAGPIIESVTRNPPQPAANQNLIIEASVVDNAGNGLARVDLHYRINFDAEGTFQIFDNGLGADTVAGDGIFTGLLSNGLYAAGDMVRWYVTAEDDGGEVSRAPFFADQTGNNQSAQYNGTVVTDPGISTVLPVFTIFVEDPNAARTDAGTRASVFYDGEFYDNVYIRRRGFTTANWNKRKFKIDFNRGEDFRYSDDAPRVTEINLQSHFLEVGGSPNTSYMREVLGFAFMQEVGVAASNAFHIHVEQNGGFFGLYSIVEQVDDEFLERNGLDPDGVLYKSSGSNSLGNLRPNPTEAGYNIVHDNGTFAELNDLTNGINAANPDRWAYLFDRINLPALINEMAAHATIIHHDRLPKNYYMYLDPETQEWTRIPWDFDMPFAVGGLLNNENYFSPLYGDDQHPQDGGTSDTFNHLYDAILDNPTTREMYLRRLRTLMDTYLDASTGYFENLVNTLASQIRADAEADDLIWGAGDIDDGLNEILNISLPTRRNQLFNIYGPSGNGLIPAEQIANPTLSIGVIDHSPAGDQDREYIEVINNNGFAVDISGWTVEGGITHTFAPGTVIAAGSTLYITPSSNAFRARPTGPSGGQQLFVQQWDSGNLSSFGETVTIRRANGTVAATKSYVGDPTPEQEHLRITELHYNPAGPSAAEITAGFTDSDQFEFVELINTSTTETLDLAGVEFSDGVDAVFTGPSATVLETDFETDPSGFNFELNSFNGTTQPNVASGEYDSNGGSDGGAALRVRLVSADNGPDHGPSSGAFERTITLESAGEVTFTFDYRLLFGGGFESDEIGQAIAEIDGVRLGNDTDGSLKSYVGDGNNGPAFDTGWVTFSTTIVLDAGTHTLTLGAYYNKSTLDNEFVDAWYDNITITAGGPLPLAPGERALLVSDLAAFTQRYGQRVVDSAAAVIQYSGNLANGGESLKLNDANGSTILDFRYEDGTGPGEELWPTLPDGAGPSLVVVDTEGDYSDGKNWAASATANGTPGGDEVPGLLGDITGDGFVGAADLDALLAFWGDRASSSPEAGAADLNNDGTVNGPDLSIVIANFGNGTPPAAPTSNGDTPDDPDPATDNGDGGGVNDGDGNDDTGHADGNAGGTGDTTGDSQSGNGQSGDSNTDGNAGPAPGPDPATRNPSRRPNSEPNPGSRPAALPTTKPASKPTTPPALTPAQQRAATQQANADALALARPSDTPTPDPMSGESATPARRFDALDIR